jgi:uncharacterized protein YigA (DUF484 family)
MSMDILSHEQVAQFLKDNPDFFSHHGDLLAQISVPHPYSGQAISIGERQVLVLRDRTQNLEGKLKEFIQFAEENDAIGDKMHRLSLGLMRGKTLPAALQNLYLALNEDFAIPHVAIRVWGAEASGLDEFAPVSEDLRTLTATLLHPQCGPEAPAEARAWFGESGAHLQSFALTRLKEVHVEGLLVLASEDPKRFFPEMGTLYLNWLGELVAAAVARFR